MIMAITILPVIIKDRNTTLPWVCVWRRTSLCFPYCKESTHRRMIQKSWFSWDVLFSWLVSLNPSEKQFPHRHGVQWEAQIPAPLRCDLHLNDSLLWAPSSSSLVQFDSNWILNEIMYREHLKLYTGGKEIRNSAKSKYNFLVLIAKS